MIKFNYTKNHSKKAGRQSEIMNFLSLQATFIQASPDRIDLKLKVFTRDQHKGIHPTL
jgi:hypothetical protein